MREPIEVRIDYTAEDYARGAKYVGSRRFIVRYLFLFPLIIIAVMALFSYLTNPAKFSRNIIPLVVTVIVLMPVFYFISRRESSFLVRKQFERIIKSSPALQETKTVVFDEEGLKGHQNLSGGEIKWEAFVEAAETEDDFYFSLPSERRSLFPKERLPMNTSRISCGI